MAKLLRSNGAIEELSIGPSPECLPRLQELVGGYIEVVPIGGTKDLRDVLVVNDDGSALRLPVNRYATMLARHVLPFYGIVRGDVVRATIEAGGTTRERFL